MTRGPCRARVVSFAFAAAVLTCGMGGSAKAVLTRAELATVAATPEPGAQLPLDAALVDGSGQIRTLGQRLGNRPALLVMADARCTQLCGPILSVVGSALAGTGLAAGRDYGLIVINFDPAATGADENTMRETQLGAGTALAAAAQMVSGTPQDDAAIETSLGYTTVYDAEVGRFAHPTDVFVLTPDGRLSRELGGLSLEPETVRLALVEAGQWRIGTVADRLHLLCYGLDPLTGRYTGMATMALRIGAGLTVAALAAVLLLLLRRRGEADGAA